MNCTNNSFLLVERSSVRYKMDSFHKQGGAESDFKRLKIDIEDLCLGCVETVKLSGSVIVVGKHLCGGATDMGIRCAVETLSIRETSQLSPSSRLSSSDVPALNVRSVNNHDTPQHSLTHPPDIVESYHDTPQHSLTHPPDIVESYQCSNVSETNSLAANTSHNAYSSGDTSNVCISSSNNLIYEHEHPSGTGSDNHKQDKLPTDGIGVIHEQKDNADICDTGHESTHLDKPAAGKDRTISDYQDKLTCTGQNKCKPNYLQERDEPPIKVQKLTNKDCTQMLPKGIAIALCCHHQCTWDTYLGKDFMRDCGITPQDFDLLTRLSSWATCAKVTAKSDRAQRNKLGLNEQPSNNHKGEKTSQDDDNGVVETENKSEDLGITDLVNMESCKPLREQLSVKEREDIGSKCKRLIDTGRLHYLRSKGMESHLFQYTSQELTPENVVLVALDPKLVTY